MTDNEFTVLREHGAEHPHGVTVLANPAGVELMRTTTTGRLTLLLIPVGEVPAVREALQRWEADHAG